MKTTKEQRDALRWMIAEADGDVEIVIGDHLHYQAPLAIDLLDDADRGDECAALEAENERLREQVSKLSDENARLGRTIHEDAALVVRLRDDLERERRLHHGDHEILRIVTGVDKAYLWSPAQARAWVESKQVELDELLAEAQHDNTVLRRQLRALETSRRYRLCSTCETCNPDKCPLMGGNQ
jgi:hypothetical protein